MQYPFMAFTKDAALLLRKSSLELSLQKRSEKCQLRVSDLGNFFLGMFFKFFIQSSNSNFPDYRRL